MTNLYHEEQEVMVREFHARAGKVGSVVSLRQGKIYGYKKDTGTNTADFIWNYVVQFTDKKDTEYYSFTEDQLKPWANSIRFITED